MHFTLVSRFNLAFNLVAIEQRCFVFVKLNLTFVVRHYLLYKSGGEIVGFYVIDDDFANIRAQIIAYCTNNHVAFLKNKVRCV